MDLSQLNLVELAVDTAVQVVLVDTAVQVVFVDIAEQVVLAVD